MIIEWVDKTVLTPCIVPMLGSSPNITGGSNNYSSDNTWQNAFFLDCSSYVQGTGWLHSCSQPPVEQNTPAFLVSFPAIKQTLVIKYWKKKAQLQPTIKHSQDNVKRQTIMFSYFNTSSALNILACTSKIIYPYIHCSLVLPT